MLKTVASQLRRVISFSKYNFPALVTNTAPNLNENSANQVISASQNLEENPDYKATYTPRPKLRNNSTVSTSSENTKAGKKVTASFMEDTPIIWMDLEMTGLDITKDVVMEVGCVITGPNLEEVARLPEELIINVPGTILDSMDAWCISTHGSSGLTEACRASTLTTSAAEERLLTFLQRHTEAGVCPMGGNSITYDRFFLLKHMPKVLAHLHYRSIDVTSVRELIRRWYPKESIKPPPKRLIHKTMADIEDSIGELQYYRSAFFVQPCSVTGEIPNDSVRHNSVITH